MVLEGTVTNVAAFGAFVDIGVHQDGLVHVSQLADRFIKDAHEVVKAGDVVKVRVLEIDLQRKRISLTMRRDAENGAPPPKRDTAPTQRHQGQRPPQPKPQRSTSGPPPQGALAAALAEAMRKK
jgi:uncharacterized protein